MSDATSYWLIEGGKAADEMAAMTAHAQAQRKLIAAFCERHGGTGEVLRGGGYVAGIRIDTAPDAKVWAEDKEWSGFYRPRRNSKEGKAIARELGAFRLPDAWTFTQKFFGIAFVHTGLRSIESATHEIIAGKDYIVAPDSDELKPIDGLRRIKASEYWAMREKSDAAMESLAPA